MAKHELEKLENNRVKITVTVDAQEFEEAVQRSYLKNRSRLQIQGFRKGKVPRKVAEKMMGKDVFYNDAIEDLIQRTYPEAVVDCAEDAVGTPEFNMEKIGEEGMIYTAEITVKPEVKLGDYKSMEIEKIDIDCTEEEIDEIVEADRQQHSTPHSIINRPVENGDMIKLDFKGTIDGEAFAGGVATDYPLEIGSGMFIPGFEEQLIGVMPENETDVNVTFPDNYPDSELRGKDAVFHCKVREIVESELPEVNEAFIRAVSDSETLEDYREGIRKQIMERKTAEAEQKTVEAIMDKLIEEAEIDIPDVMIEEETQRLADDFSKRIVQQGMNMEQYFEVTGTNAEMLSSEMKPHAEKRVRGKLILEAIAKEQNLEVTEAEIDEELETSFAEFGKHTAEELRRMVGENYVLNLRSDLAKRKAQNWLVENVVK